MRAIVQDRYGPPSVLHLEEVARHDVESAVLRNPPPGADLEPTSGPVSPENRLNPVRKGGMVAGRAQTGMYAPVPRALPPKASDNWISIHPAGFLVEVLGLPEDFRLVHLIVPIVRFNLLEGDGNVAIV